MYVPDVRLLRTWRKNRVIVYTFFVGGQSDEFVISKERNNIKNSSQRDDFMRSYRIYKHCAGL
jgi:hypothetical protein